MPPGFAQLDKSSGGKDGSVSRASIQQSLKVSWFWKCPPFGLQEGQETPVADVDREQIRTGKLGSTVDAGPPWEPPRAGPQPPKSGRPSVALRVARTMRWFAFWDRWWDCADLGCLPAPPRSLVRLVCSLAAIQSCPPGQIAPDGR